MSEPIKYQKIYIDEQNVCFVYFFEGLRYCFTAAEDNKDYQEYLTWLAEGNEPEIIHNIKP